MMCLNLSTKPRIFYGYKNFINDAGGSVCELDNPEVLEILARETLILYIRISPDQEKTLVDRAKSDPKPLYYRESFLDEKLAEFMSLKNYSSTETMPPDEFVSWVFPELFKSRLPRDEAIAADYGYTLDANEVALVNNEDDFFKLVAKALDAQT